ncbi:hypothetical protein SDC9_205789 [bioreactor metagenome]|uniref:Uncharacterized protein n=1 Tax=bioreactor metagenome TaxID=1076179 RepID=A0A645J349_9ZZZZ
MFSAIGARNILFLDVSFQLLIGPAVDGNRHLIVIFDIIFNQLICPEAGLAAFAVDKRIRKSAYMA